MLGRGNRRGDSCQRFFQDACEVRQALRRGMVVWNDLADVEAMVGRKGGRGE